MPRGKKHSHWSDTIRHRDFVMQMQEMVDKDPSMFMRAIGRDLHVSEHCIRSCMMEDICYKTYRMQKGQLLLCPTSRKSQKWLGFHFFDLTAPDFWPPNSSDLNPRDFFVRSAVERDTNRTPCIIKDQLISCNQASFTSFRRDTVKKACQRF